MTLRRLKMALLLPIAFPLGFLFITYFVIVSEVCPAMREAWGDFKKEWNDEGSG